MRRSEDILAKLLDLLDLTGELVGEGLLQGLYHDEEALLAGISGWDRGRLGGMTTYLGLAGVAAQAIEGSGLHHRLSSQGGRAKGRSSESERGSHFESNKSLKKIDCLKGRMEERRGGYNKDTTKGGKGKRREEGSNRGRSSFAVAFFFSI